MQNRFTGFLAAFLIAVTAGCSAGSTDSEKLEKDTLYTATLDYETDTIIKPLSEYTVSRKQIDQYNLAHSYIMRDCLSGQGYSYPLSISDDPLSSSREYGMWNPSYTKKYGFGITSEYLDEQDRINEAMSLIPDSAIEECYENNKEKFNEMLPPEELETVASRLKFEAGQAAAADPEWKAAREQWWQCLSENGLTPRKFDDAWGSQEDHNLSAEPNQADLSIQQENIRLATISAECSQETGMAQTLANLEAAYQGPLIKKNQTALNAEKEKIAAKVQKVEEVIATYQ